MSHAPCPTSITELCVFVLQQQKGAGSATSPPQRPAPPGNIGTCRSVQLTGLSMFAQRLASSFNPIPYELDFKSFIRIIVCHQCTWSFLSILSIYLSLSGLARSFFINSFFQNNFFILSLLAPIVVELRKNLFSIDIKILQELHLLPRREVHRQSPRHRRSQTVLWLECRQRSNHQRQWVSSQNRNKII